VQWKFCNNHPASRQTLSYNGDLLRGLIMRKTMLCLLLLSSCVSFGQAPPQWKVVKALFLNNQAATIPQTTLFTPTENDIFRVSAYMSGANIDTSQNDAWSFFLTCTDLVEPQNQCGVDMTVQGGGGTQSTFIGAYVFGARKGTPVGYFTSASTNPPPPPSSNYTVVVTIERLQ